MMRGYGHAVCLLLVCIGCFLLSSESLSDELWANGPMDFYDKAMEFYLNKRREKGNSITLSSDGEVMQLANDYAVRRMRRRPKEQLSFKALSIANGDAMLESSGEPLTLPSPSDGLGSDPLARALLQSETSSSALETGTDGSVLSMVVGSAASVAMNEEFGMGAIAQAGALVMGSEGEWLEFAEKKIQRDEELDHHNLMWELGSGLIEENLLADEQFKSQQQETRRDSLLSLISWFEKNGGRFRLVKPVINGLEKDSESGNFRGGHLEVLESLTTGDVALTVPLKTMLCKQTARNVLLTNRGRYLGEELKKTFERSEELGLAVFLLHEYYKEMNGNGSKWGPLIRSLRMRLISTATLKEISGTLAAKLYNSWLREADDHTWWLHGMDGPCSPTSGVCRVKPLERIGGETRFSIHQIRWALWIVRQNAVRIRHVATGLDFLALVPFYDLMEKYPGESTSAWTFDLDGTVSVRITEQKIESTTALQMPVPGNWSDAEWFLRHLEIPEVETDHTQLSLKLPGMIPHDSAFRSCLGSTNENKSDDCKTQLKSQGMLWRSKELGRWREVMNLPPRLQDIRIWANRLHLYGDEEEELRLTAANQLLAGLPLPVDQMPAEEQLMYLGIARDSEQASAVLTASQSSEPRPPPQLYTAPDPTEDPEAEKSMEHLAYLAVQAQKTVLYSNTALNATRVVLNQTRDFFTHGVLPAAGLDVLDLFLLKKIGMLSRCGVDKDMTVSASGPADSLLCALRVHLLNETEMTVFCPAEARVWEDNCLDVEFSVHDAVTERNEQEVISVLRSSLEGLLSEYPTTIEMDQELLDKIYFDREGSEQYSDVARAAILLRMREKKVLHRALTWADEQQNKLDEKKIHLQLEDKQKEREAADERTEQRKRFLEEVRMRAEVRPELATLEVNMGNGAKENITLHEGADFEYTISSFCQKFGIQPADQRRLSDALRKRVVSPSPLELMLGVVTPAGQRHILGIPQGSNATVETSVFCTKHDPSANPLDSAWCQTLLARVNERIHGGSFIRNVLFTLSVDSPDTRKLKFVVYEGEQHDLLQQAADFVQLYHLPTESGTILANEVHKRLAPVALQIPVALPSKRQVQIRLSKGENITNVVEGFSNFYELEFDLKVMVHKAALGGMLPGSFVS